MLITFSGTGNSLAVSRRLGARLGGETVTLENRMLLKPEETVLEVAAGEPVIWVCPVYSWGIPPVVERFIRKVRFKGAHQSPHFLVVTCGDDIGYADNCWRQLIGRRGWSPRGSFSVTMPNTYVLMKGFDVDSPGTEARKTEEMPARVDAVASAIAQGFSGDDVVRGNAAWTKTYVIRPLFNIFCTSPRPFHSSEACVGCGKCSRGCPMENITMKEGRPQWHNHCALCLRCYHICPEHAVEYGKATRSKGQKPVYN